MREICSSGSVGERGGNEPLYPENTKYEGHGAWGTWGEDHRAKVTERPCEIASLHFVNFTGQAG